MIRGIDHLIFACTDPEAAASELEAAIGVSATGGGRHDGLGTYNRIVWLADGSYLELVGVEDREVALKQPVAAAVVRALDERGGGLVTYALTDDELELTVNALSGAGSSLGPVTHGARRRPDGELAEWWLSLPEGEIGPENVPFLIQHAYSGPEWSYDALRERATMSHPMGSPAILVRLDLATTDPPSLAARYHEQLGLEVWAVADLAVCNLGAHTIRLLPRHEMEVPAAITLGAQVAEPRTMEALGARFEVERVELPLPAPNRA